MRRLIVASGQVPHAQRRVSCSQYRNIPLFAAFSTSVSSRRTSSSSSSSSSTSLSTTSYRPFSNVVATAIDENVTFDSAALQQQERPPRVPKTPREALFHQLNYRVRTAAQPRRFYPFPTLTIHPLLHHLVARAQAEFPVAEMTEEEFVAVTLALCRSLDAEGMDKVVAERRAAGKTISERVLYHAVKCHASRASVDKARSYFEESIKAFAGANGSPVSRYNTHVAMVEAMVLSGKHAEADALYADAVKKGTFPSVFPSPFSTAAGSSNEMNLFMGPDEGRMNPMNVHLAPVAVRYALKVIKATKDATFPTLSLAANTTPSGPRRYPKTVDERVELEKKEAADRAELAKKQAQGWTLSVRLWHDEVVGHNPQRKAALELRTTLEDVVFKPEHRIKLFRSVSNMSVLHVDPVSLAKALQSK